MDFIKAQPQVGSKLMQLTGNVAIGKQLQNIKRAAQTYIKPPIPWQAELTSHEYRDDSLLQGLNSGRDGQLAMLLKRSGFQLDEVGKLCRLAQFHQFSRKEVMVRSSQPWPYVSQQQPLQTQDWRVHDRTVLAAGWWLRSSSALYDCAPL